MDFLTNKDRRMLTRFAFWSTLLMLAIIPVQILIFSIWPMPTNATEWIEMFQTHPVVSVLHLDFLYVINNALLCIIYLGLFALLINEERGLALIALVLGLVGIAAYFPTVRVFEIREISRIYHEEASVNRTASSLSLQCVR